MPARCLRLIHQRPPRRALEIVVLAASERPQKRGEPEPAEKKRDRYEPGERGHLRSSRRMVLSRTALAVTETDETDIATAAMSGVT